MNTLYSTFVFESFSLDERTKEARFVYSYTAHEPDADADSGLWFEEVVKFETTAEVKETPAVRQLLFDLHIALGMSYWKAYCPKEIVVKSGQFTAADAAFWNTVYTKGLGEFFYRNQIDFRELINFPVHVKDTQQGMEGVEQGRGEAREVVRHIYGETLLPLGGGKDSLTSVKLLEEMQIPFETVSLGQYDVVDRQVEKLGVLHHRVHRRIDAQLFELNKRDAYNGHVPISVIYAFSSLLIAAWNNHRYLALSNEQSANIGNVEYLGSEMNHQWSKSIEFEEMLQEHLQQHGVRIHYFSLLRPLTEYRIAEMFSQDFDRWAGMFTSCNRNFTQEKSNQTSQAERAYWCGTCPKCFFVFTMLAAWMPKEKLVSALGINPWELPENSALLKELLGLESYKPFECVGTPNEMIAAAEKMFARAEYSDNLLMQEYMELRRTLPIMHASEDALAIGAHHNLPLIFEGYLQNLQNTV